MWPFKIECRCACQCHQMADVAAGQPRVDSTKPEIPATSPAFALERSLSDPETRGEWVVIKDEPYGQTYGWTIQSTRYRNDARDITITASWSMNAGNCLYTPFTLTDDEKAIVREALCAWNAKNEAIRESEALARLVSPVAASGTEARRAETGTGSVHDGPVPKADAQTPSPYPSHGA